MNGPYHNSSSSSYKCSEIDLSTFNRLECPKSLGMKRGGGGRYYLPPGFQEDMYFIGFKDLCPCELRPFCTAAKLAGLAAYDLASAANKLKYEIPANRITSCAAPTPFPTPIPTASPTPSPPTAHPTPAPTPRPTPRPIPAGWPTPSPTSPTPSPTTASPTATPTAVPTPPPTPGPDQCDCFSPTQGWSSTNKKCEAGKYTDYYEAKCCAQHKTPGREPKATGGDKTTCEKIVPKVYDWWMHLPFGLDKVVFVVINIVRMIYETAVHTLFSWRQQYPEATNLENLPTPVQETISKAYELHMKSKEEAKVKGVDWAF